LKALIETDNKHKNTKKRAFTGYIALLLTIFFTILSASTARASAPGYEWTQAMGGASGSSGESTAIDASGNIYITGYFSGSMDFDPTAGVDTHTSSANTDMFLTRINADGSYAWTKTSSGGTYSCASGSSVAIDASGNIYVTGFFCQTVDFDPTAAVDEHTSIGYNDSFLMRINADSSYAWTKTTASAALGISYGASVAIDNGGNIFVAGYFNKTVDFDPTTGVDNHTSAGGIDISLTRINADGSYGWTKTMGGTGNEYGLSLAADASGNLYMAGFFAGTVDFDPTTGTDNHTSAGYDDIFLTRINADGSYAWTKSIGSTGVDRTWSMAMDPNGNIYLNGFFSGSVDFDPSPAIDTHIAVGQTDSFVTRINADGSYGWTQTISDPASGSSLSTNDNLISVDAEGNIYLSGYFSGTIDFDPSTGIDNRTSSGPRSIFISRINADGAYSWTRTMGSPNSWVNSPMPVAADANRNIFITGHFSKTVDFDPGPGVDEHTSHGLYGDIFLTKLSQKSDELAVDFGSTYGLYTRDNNAVWTRLSDQTPDTMATCDLDGDGKAEIVAGFAGTGVWSLPASGAPAVLLNPIDGELIACADLDGNGQKDIIVDFGPSYGLWARYNNASWTKLHFLSPVIMTTGDLNGDGQAEVIGEFAGLGIWYRQHSTGTWSRLHYLNAELMATGDLNGDGKDELIVDFGDAYGIWARYSTGLWAKLQALSPVKLTTGDLDGNGLDDVIAEFSGTGIWVRYSNNPAWKRVHGFYSESLSTGDLDGSGRDDLIVDFGIFGIWVKRNNNLWQKIHNINPELTSAGNLDGY